MLFLDRHDVIALLPTADFITAQAATTGELQHAIAAGPMTAADVHAEPGQVVTGQRPGRTATDV